MPLLILQAKAPLEPRDDRTLVAVSQICNLQASILTWLIRKFEDRSPSEGV